VCVCVCVCVNREFDGFSCTISTLDISDQGLPFYQF